MTDNRNTILAVILSGLVLIAWQYFYNVPQMEKQRAQTQAQSELAKPSPQTAPGSAPAPGSTAPPPGRHATATTQPRRRRRPGRQPRRRDRRDPAHQDRDPARYRQHLAEGRAHRRPRADPISATPSIPNRPPSCCSRPRGTAHPYYAEFGWVPATGSTDPHARPEHDVAAGRFRQPVAEQPGDAEIRQWRRPHLQAHHLRSTTAISSPSRTTSAISATRRSTLYPFALISRHGAPEGLRLLHPA